MEKRAKDSPTAEIEEWRRDQLLRAGFEDELAFELASDPGVDLHTLIELVERGCSPDLALRILAPLENEMRGLRFNFEGAGSDDD